MRLPEVPGVLCTYVERSTACPPPPLLWSENARNSVGSPNLPKRHTPPPPPKLSPPPPPPSPPPMPRAL